MGNYCMKEAFPLLFSLASHKNAMVSDLWEGGGSGGQWLVQIRRSFQDWEMEGYPNFWNLFTQQM